MFSIPFIALPSCTNYLWQDYYNIQFPCFLFGYPQVQDLPPSQESQNIILKYSLVGCLGWLSQ